MKLFCFKSIVFFGVFFSIVFGVSRLDSYIPNNNNNVLRVQQAKRFSNLDILFVGNSYTYSGVDTKYFTKLGISSYNLGIATAGASYYSILIQDYIRSSQSSPCNLLLMLSMTTFSTYADNWLAYPIHRHLNIPVSNERVAHTDKLPLKKYLQLVLKSYRKSIGGGASALFGNNDADASADASKVYKQRGSLYNNTVSTDKIFKDTKHMYRNMMLNRFDKDSFEKVQLLAQHYRNQGINVVFFEPPTFRLEEFFNETFKKQYRKALTELEENGFIVISNNLNLSAQYFRNIDHLNSYGAEVYTKYLINAFHQRNALKCVHRG